MKYLRATKVFIALTAPLLLAAECSFPVVKLFGSGEFGVRPLPSTTTRTITIGNSGNVDAVLGSVTSSALGISPPFALTGGTCRNGASLPPNGGSCTLMVAFAPAAAGSWAQELRVTYNWSGSGEADKVLSTWLSGSAAEPVALSPAGYDFRQKALGTSLTKGFTLTNWQDFAITLGSVNDAGLGLSLPFSLTGGTCATGAVLGANGGSCTFAVSFSPTRLGSSSDRIELQYRLSGSGTSNARSWPISGTGVTPDKVVSMGAGSGHHCAVLASGNVR
ncbi:MAG TPA: choice-of-anchor D domain-containing protein, partial [Polyangiaceae bacterium]|nr:choice-of-anchor D domain-containing protein [Polyangiaceae bacterium]